MNRVVHEHIVVVPVGAGCKSEVLRRTSSYFFRAAQVICYIDEDVLYNRCGVADDKPGILRNVLVRIRQWSSYNTSMPSSCGNFVFLQTQVELHVWSGIIVTTRTRDPSTDIVIEVKLYFPLATSNPLVTGVGVPPFDTRRLRGFVELVARHKWCGPEELVADREDW